MDMMDPMGYCTMRLFREHCSFVNGVFVKDMSTLGRNMKDTIIIDNSPTSYMLQPECGLPILSWYDDMSDMALYEMMPLLIELSKVNDVREAIPSFIKSNQIDMNLAMQVCVRLQAQEARHAQKKKELELQRQAQIQQQQ